jgi:alkylation response protein AidB-like acyl-CoA dehydrogenase
MIGDMIVDPDLYYQEHTLFIDSIRQVTAKEITPSLERWEEEGRFPDSLFKTLGAQGFHGVLIPEEYGGIGGDHRLAAAWCETFGEICAVGLTTAINMHSLVISNALNRYGSLELKSKWLPRAMTGHAIGAYAFTEPGAGSDLASLRTTATRKGTEWVLNGAKTFITNGERADFILVLTKNDASAGYKGFTTFLVDTTLPGFTVPRTLDKLGWRSSDTAELVFDNLMLPESAVLGTVGAGWIQAAESLNWERLMLTLTSLAGARICFQETLRYAQDRKAFGKSIGEFGVIREMLRAMYGKISHGTALSRYALELLVAGVDCRAHVSYAKRMVCEDAIWIADRAIQIHGGYGYTKEYSPERWWRDLRLMTIGGGTSEVMAEIAAKSALAKAS